MSYGVVLKKNIDFSNLDIIWKDNEVRVYYNEDLNIDEIKVGDLIKVRGTFKEYQGKKQIFADFVTKVEIDPKFLEKILNYLEKNFYNYQ